MDQQVIHDPSFFDDDELTELSVDDPGFMSDDDVIKICKREIELSEEYMNTELESNREQALAYYFGDPRGDETEGNSETQSMDVADMVEATLAEVMPLYSQLNIASFNATDENDEDQAQLESNYCNYTLMELNSGYTVLYSAIKDSLLQKNGLVEIFVDEHVDVEYDEYKGLNDFEIQALLVEEKDKKKEVVKAELDQETGLIDLTVKTFVKIKKLCIEPVEPENFLFATNHKNSSTVGIRFCGRRLITSKSYLVSQGYDQEIIDNLSPYTGDGTETRRNRTQSEDNFETGDNATALVEVFRCYVEMDYDNDGIAELHRVIISDDVLLERTYAKTVPFASGSPFLLSHRFMGMSLFDKLKNIQDQKTAFIRQYINNATQMNNRRLEIIDGQVNLEDVLNSRAGGVVRSKIRGAINPIPVDDIGPSCILALDYLDKVRSERGGASLDMQSADMQVGANVGSEGVERQYTSKEKMAALMSRTLAETLIRQIYLIIHATLRESFVDKYPIKIGDEWKKVQPSSWMKRDRVKIDIGMSAGERSKKVGTLSKNLELQLKAMELDAEDILTNRKKIYNTIRDMLHASGTDNVDRYWIDPDSPKAIDAYKQKVKNAQARNEESKQMQTQMFEYQKTIEDNKDEINILKEENKSMLQDKKLVQDMIKHNDKMKAEYVALELDNNRDIPGEGLGEGDING